MKNRVFIHVHRTGGSSIWHSLVPLAMQRGVGICDIYHESKLRRGIPVEANETLRRLRPAIADLPCLFHHHTTERIDDFHRADDVVYATVLRDPVQRLVSLVSHLRGFMQSPETEPRYVHYYAELTGREFYKRAVQPNARLEELLEIAVGQPFFTDYYTTLFSSLFGEDEPGMLGGDSPVLIHRLAEVIRNRVVVLGHFEDLQSAYGAIVEAFGLGGSDLPLQRELLRAPIQPVLSVSERRRCQLALESEYALLDELRIWTSNRLRRAG